MPDHCCGGNCKNQTHAGHSCGGRHHAKGRGPGWAWAALLTALAGVIAISTYAIAFQPSAPATPPPAAPSKPAPAVPAKPEATKPAQPAKAAEPTPGVIRHGRAEPIAKPAGAIRIATYNIENLFDKDALSDETGSLTQAKPVAHRKAAAEAIHKINADIIAFEEVESKDTITKFRDEYLSDMGYTHIASIDAGDPRGIEQSVLSRFPLKDVKNWPNTPLDGVHPDKLGKKPNPEAGKPLVLKRSPLRVTATVPAAVAGGKDLDITLFVVHQKSGPYHGYLREAEAKKILATARDFEKEHPGTPVIILGDFNARMSEPPLAVYTTGGLLDAMSGVTGGVESKEFTSHVSGRTIDHMLLNGPAAAMVSTDTRFVLGTMQRPEDVDWRKTEPPAGYASDHYPVVLDLLPTEPPTGGVKRGLRVSPTTDAK